MPFVDVESDLGPDGTVTFLCPTLEPILTEHPAAIEAARLEHQRAGRPRPARALAVALLDELYPGRVPPRLLDRLAASFDQLPPFGCIHYVNFLGDRGAAAADSLRIIACVPRARFERYLGALGGSRAGGAWEALAELRSYRAWTNVDLDLTPGGVGPRLGLYEWFDRPRAGDRVLRRLLATLVARGLTTRERGRALLRLVARGARSLTFKLIATGGALSVKAYLEIAPGA
jgi:hypothetical protein